MPALLRNPPPPPPPEPVKSHSASYENWQRDWQEKIDQQIQKAIAKSLSRFEPKSRRDASPVSPKAVPAKKKKQVADSPQTSCEDDQSGAEREPVEGETDEDEQNCAEVWLD